MLFMLLLLLGSTGETVFRRLTRITVTGGHVTTFGTNKGDGTSVDGTGMGADDESFRWHGKNYELQIKNEELIFVFLYALDIIVFTFFILHHSPCCLIANFSRFHKYPISSFISAFSFFCPGLDSY